MSGRWLTLWTYWRTCRLHFADRAALERHQARRLQAFLPWLTRHSPYFAPCAGRPLPQWPLMDKALLMAEFDRMNTASLKLADALRVAQAAEASRDFQPSLHGITVGLSSGTSAQRGLFAVSRRETAHWAGVLLAKALPEGLFAGERVALLLRANSNLYTAVQTRWISFEFFDLFRPFAETTRRLAGLQPTIIVAPAQVLRQLALQVLAGTLRLRPKRVISAAEVLEPQDRELLRRAFGEVHEVYQATEGFLASTCEHGVLHLNEEFLHVEPEWLDPERRRFVPIITDFTRRTQPIVRYRLNDVLVARATPCPCGRATRAIDHIEGRCDDMLLLPGEDGRPVPVFADLLARALAQCLPLESDYRLEQHANRALHLHASVAPGRLAQVRDHLQATLAALGVAVRQLEWTLNDQLPAFDPTTKRRRIRRLPEAA